MPDNVNNTRVSYDYSNIDRKVTKAHEQIEVELSKGSQANVDRIRELVLKAAGYVFLKTERVYEENSFNGIKESMELRDLLAGTHKKSDKFWMTLGAGTLNILGGIAGFGALSSVGALQTVAKASQPLMGMGNGVGTLNSLPENRDQAQRVVYQVTMEDTKRKSDERTQNASRVKGNIDQLLQIIQAIESNRARVITSMTSASA